MSENEKMKAIERVVGVSKCAWLCKWLSVWIITFMCVCVNRVGVQEKDVRPTLPQEPFLYVISEPLMLYVSRVRDEGERMFTPLTRCSKRSQLKCRLKSQRRPRGPQGTAGQVINKETEKHNRSCAETLLQIQHLHCISQQTVGE